MNVYDKCDLNQGLVDMVYQAAYHAGQQATRARMRLSADPLNHPKTAAALRDFEIAVDAAAAQLNQAASAERSELRRAGVHAEEPTDGNV